MASSDSNDNSTVFALLDANNFFVSCERVFRPDLKNKPVVVLSNNDGIIIARSNEVKRLGVPMAHPLHKVRGLLEKHDTQIFSANFKLYGDFSRRINQIVSEYSPDVEVYSVDESFIDLSKLNCADYHRLASEMQQKILKWTGVPVSIGVAPTKTLAKATSEYAKKNPDSNGTHSAMSSDEISKVLDWLPVEDVWGIGFRWAPRLKEFGITSASQFTGLSENWVRTNMSVRGHRTWKELKGESCIPLNESLYVDDHEQKSMGTTRLFGQGINNFEELQTACANHAARLGAKLRRRKQIAWKFYIYLQTRSKPYQTVGKSFWLPYPTSDTTLLISETLKSLEEVYDSSKRYRRVGLILDNLQSDQHQQLRIDQQPSVELLAKQELIMKAMDSINSVHGSRKLVNGSQGFVRKNANWQSKSQHRTPNYTTSWHDIPAIRL